jgi:hypothetical protein
MRLRHVLLAAGGICAAGLGIGLGPGVPGAAVPAPAPPPAAAAARAFTVGAPAASPATAAGPQSAGARPARDADRNTVFRTGASGGLIIDEAVAQRLEALVVRLDALREPAGRARLEALVGEGLPEPQAAEALRLLGQYLAYGEAEAQLLSQPRQAEDVASAQDRFERLVRLRREQFDAQTAQALFADEEARTRDSFSRWAMAH